MHEHAFITSTYLIAMKDKQTTSHIMLIRPARFVYNSETAVNNAFQQADTDQEKVAQKAAAEFQGLLQTLLQNGVQAFAINDTPVPATPDSIFPNNWISTHADGSVFLYPMFAANRRLERKPSVLEMLRMQYHVDAIHDLSIFEEQDTFLEGTGSMVLDREHKIAYACLSPRTDKKLLQTFCEEAGYTAVAFDAVDETGKAIYHTNVMMAVGHKYVVICLDSVPDGEAKDELIKAIASTGKALIPISFHQMNHFAGNMLQVENKSNEKILLMSSQAYESLTAEQIETLQQYNRIVHSDISTIEKNGGGSVRCMLAEIHLVKK